MHVVAPTGDPQKVMSQDTAVFCGVLGKQSPGEGLITNVNTPPFVGIEFINYH